MDKECPEIDFLDFILHLKIFYARLRFSLLVNFGRYAIDNIR